jgi:hypothetical protein
MEKSDQALPPARSPAVTAGAEASFCHDEFEYGFVLLAAEVAEQLRGEDDHTVITAEADPTTFDAVGAAVHGANVALFCLADTVALAPADGGALVAYGAACGDDTLRSAFAEVDTEWLPVTSLVLPSGRLVGQSANHTLAAARASGSTIEVTLAAGTYDVLRAFEDEESEATCSRLWLRRRG